ncbi:phospholipase D-like domain-containing protein [Rhizobium ruizarguesonis]
MANREAVEDLIQRHEAIFDSVETIAVRAAPAMVHGRPDHSNCHIEVIARRPAALDLPPQIDGIAVLKIAATMEEQALRYNGLTINDADVLSREWRTGLLRGANEAPRDYSLLTYKPLNPSKLVEVDEDCELTLNVSPDAGWGVLSEYLTDPSDLDIGMYDLTAPHIVNALEAIGQQGGMLDLCLGPKASLGSGTKAEDIPEADVKARLEAAFGERFRFAWASVGGRKQFPSAYHIKVAVRDAKQFWLSSGNWQSSNQPKHRFAGDAAGTPTDGADMARYNREWHIVVKSSKLAEIFKAYLDKDRETSEFDESSPEAGSLAPLPASPVRWPSDDEFTLEFRVPDGPDAALAEAPRPYHMAFPPKKLARRKRRIMPLLTPDNFGEEVLALIESATTKLWFQNQSLSINVTPSPLYRRLLTALREKAWAIENTRIFFRDFIQEDTKDALRALDRDGFPMHKVRVMKNVHTKAILVDDHLTLIGSHNWTNEGTNYNRDASLIIDDKDVHGWYAGVLDHDWQHLAYPLGYDLAVPSAVLPLGGEQIEGIPKRLDPRMDVVKRD